MIKFEWKVLFVVLIDNFLIGGVIICIGDLVIDVFVCGKLIKLVDILGF